jgi:phosphatidylglycerophosphate synthase
MLLDGAADKLFVLSVLLTLILRGVIAWWTLPLVLARDLVVAFVAVFAVIIREWSRFRQLRPRGPGKATTVLVFAWFIAVLAPFPWLDPLRPILLVMAAGCSMLAAIDYLILFQRALREWLVSRKKGQRDRTEGQRD